MPKINFNTPMLDENGEPAHQVKFVDKMAVELKDKDGNKVPLLARDVVKIAVANAENTVSLSQEHKRIAARALRKIRAAGTGETELASSTISAVLLPAVSRVFGAVIYTQVEDLCEGRTADAGAADV